MKFLILISFIIVLAGCGIKQQQIQRQHVIQHEEEIIARFSDIPDVPFQVQLKNLIVSENNDQIQIFYTTSLSQQDLVTFYEQQMERLGWQLSAQSMLQDSFLYYHKPQRFCSIIIGQNCFSIYIGTN